MVWGFFSRCNFLLDVSVCFFVLSFCIASGTAVNVIAPVTISDPGEYHLLNDVTNCSTDCIVIQGSNIVLDGGGHTIDGIGFARPPDSNPRTLFKGVLIESATGCQNIVIKNLTVKDFGVDIYLNRVQGGSVEYCDTSDGYIGILFDYSSDLTIRDNYVFNNSQVGIDSEFYSFDVSVRNNQVINNNMAVSLHEDKGGIRVQNNLIRGNQYGIRSYFEEDGRVKSWDNLIQNNQIVQNQWGLYGSLRTTVVNNYFNNTNNTACLGSPNTWNTTLSSGRNIINGQFLGGNYWGQPNGQGFSDIAPDVDQDGICDAAYLFGPGNSDYHPLHRLSPIKVPGGGSFPLDLDRDGLFEDLNGNDRKDFADVVLYFNQMTWIVDNEPLAAFDYNKNGRIDFADVTWLFNNL